MAVIIKKLFRCGFHDKLPITLNVVNDSNYPIMLYHLQNRQRFIATPTHHNCNIVHKKTSVDEQTTQAEHANDEEV